MAETAGLLVNVLDNYGKRGKNVQGLYTASK